MGHTLEQFAASCHDILTADPGPSGRQQVCSVLQDVLRDKDFVATNLGDNVPERKILYEDPDLGFCILAHVHHGAKNSKPHDHGPHWAIYGQAEGVTEMTDWELLEPATSDKPGKVRAKKVYTLNPGMAFVYNEGDLHSPRRETTTRLIRLEGSNMEKVSRLAYESI